jgi:hypothetical protein
MINSMWSRLVGLVQNKVGVSGYQSIVLRLWTGLSEASILEGARDFSHVKNDFTRSGSPVFKGY